MNELDAALVTLRQNMDDPRKQSAFYDLFLNSSFFVPILSDEEAADKAGVLPLITEAEGNDYLMLFSSLERLKAWVTEGEDLGYIEVPGHVLALTTSDPLHWALNVGTDFSKQFHPAEIQWLREAVEQCNAQAAAEQENKG